VVCEALFTIFRKQVAHSVSAITNTAVLILCSLLLVIIPALAQAGDLERILTVRTVLAIIYYGMFATVLAYLLWTGAVGKVHGAIAGAATAMMPASSVLLSALVLKEKLLPSHLAGLALIVLGILGATLATRNAEAEITAADRRDR
jgi:drug/metabolite transporter (DMT)-like permease